MESTLLILIAMIVLLTIGMTVWLFKMCSNA
jgi:hypothetical protein